jgi:hypothetical protein
MVPAILISMEVMKFMVDKCLCNDLELQMVPSGQDLVYTRTYETLHS